MRVIIVDDEVLARRALLEHCALEPDLQVVGEFADAPSALAALAVLNPDLLLLDIQLETMSGMQLARALPRSKSSPLIVFITAYDEHALQAFEVNALDYLLKPFDAQRFASMLSRVRQRRHGAREADRKTELEALVTRLERAVQMTSDSQPRLLADAGGRLQMVGVADIEVIEADRNYVTLRVGKDVLHARSTLSHAAETMRTQPMLRINRSTLVNINHIQEVARTPRGDYVLVLSGGSTVCSSRGFREDVRMALEALTLGGNGHVSGRSR
jgi:two-component system LytT family response regulator